MANPQSDSVATKIVKATPGNLFTEPENGGKLNYETRLSCLRGYITPNALFYIRSHDPTPRIDRDTWRLRLTGDGLDQSIELSYAMLEALPQTSFVRAIECAGNARAFFECDFGKQAGDAQWHTGAIGVAEWSGVRRRDVLERAGLRADAVDVLPEGLDAKRFARPLPLGKAMADDTLIALAMNGETLPADHGFPARLVVSGWLGAASIKWLGSIRVARQKLYTHWNTRDYTLAGPDYPKQPPADGVPITLMPVMSVTELEWNAELAAGAHVVRGRAFSGERHISRAEYRIDDEPWRSARLDTPNIAAAWVRWAFDWQASPGEHHIRIRAMDQHGNRQPETVPWNDHGCLYNAVVTHPVRVVSNGC